MLVQMAVIFLRLQRQRKKTRQQRTAQKAVLLLKRTMKVLLPQKRVLLTVKLIFEYETDEDGNVIDPPEDYIPPTSKHSSETTQSSHTGESSQAHPGETTKAAHPGDSTESLKPTVPSGTLSPSRTTEAATTEAATKPYGPGSSETTAASSFNPGNSIKEENVGGPGEMISPAA